MSPNLLTGRRSNRKCPQFACGYRFPEALSKDRRQRDETQNRRRDNPRDSPETRCRIGARRFRVQVCVFDFDPRIHKCRGVACPDPCGDIDEGTVLLKTIVAAPLSRPETRLENEVAPRDMIDTVH